MGPLKIYTVSHWDYLLPPPPSSSNSDHAKCQLYQCPYDKACKCASRTLVTVAKSGQNTSHNRRTLGEILKEAQCGYLFQYLFSFIFLEVHKKLIFAKGKSLIIKKVLTIGC